MNNDLSRPPDWKKTISDIFAEYRNKEDKVIPIRELEWAADYEKSLIPSNYVFP